MLIDRRGEQIRIDFAAEEAGLLTVLAHQFADVVRDPELDDAPLLARLFPDAYRDDPDASAEFRHYTRDELEARKIGAAEQIAATATEGLVTLGLADAETWARSLTDLRTMVGTRLGIRGDDDEPAAGPLTDIYHWLGELQWLLVDQLDGP
ncbi:DUF2017 family protein [Protaetiibacter larvae]|uniref:DUF2017 family protein n=1 Tax=Protaetiibacter larvae TaxID=2592654 RepID=A0A5C1Y6X3_9MICO|nr:DUF2017 family protein [Protaetiibacter larvae]QEO09664.1 DUF2017 family protein [Protaetiibacter larvae]